MPVGVEGLKGRRFVRRRRGADGSRRRPRWRWAPRPGPTASRRSRPGRVPRAAGPAGLDRDLLLRLYDFDYRWEVYVPQAKRRWGYYVLPLLYGDRFVGRIEPRIDRKTGTLRVLDLWWEDGLRPDVGGEPGLR